MRKAEIVDLLLKELYKHRNTIEYYTLANAVRNARIAISISTGLRNNAKRLEKDGLIEVRIVDNKLQGKITHAGIRFCETTSYAYKNHPIITFEEW